MNFVKSSGTENFSNSNNVTWNSNPIYQSPESAGISWYDQATHWDPHSEGVFSIAQNSTDNPVPYWASRDQDLQGIRNEFAKSQARVQENSAASLAPQAASTSTNTSVPVAALGATEASVPGRLENAKTASKVAAGVSTAGSAGLAAASMTGPVGAALMVNAAIGSAVSGAIDTSNKSAIASDFVQNQKVQGSQSTHQAQLVRDLDTAHAQVTKSGADMGALGGPLGAWFGSLIANAIQDSAPKNLYDDLKTGYSFDGRYNPQDTGAVNSATTSQLSGESNIQSTL
nr:MAG: hypothetical protein [Polycipiviridae sp.]